MTAHTIEEIRRLVKQAKLLGKSVGFVPTMGALHEGHGRLIELCRDSSDFVVVSVFVNPTQFGPSEDYSRYPRTWESDLAICQACGCDVVFAPSAEEIYPHGQNVGQDRSWTSVDVPGLTGILEGASRPTHFRGVATIVLKLFNIVQPDLSWFGQKDYQQVAVLKRMVADLDVPVTIRVAETVREFDGLAMSSRNRYLNVEERRAATILARALRAARSAAQGGETCADRVRQIMVETIQSEPLARLDYAEVADSETLERLSRLDSGALAVALIAARIGPARLIDNLALN